jgi:creatinine amidohydrolase/Fe(II)-dependent formamide hydrolase-like protein
MDTNQSAYRLQKAEPQIVLLPVGSCEQHGPYLPIDTDLRIAQLVATKLAETFPVPKTLLLPAIPFSSSWEHKGMGTIALNITTLGAMLHDVAHSIKSWNLPVLLIIINWHGGNSVLSSLTTEITATESVPTAVIQAIALAGKAWYEHYGHISDDVHAGALETSIIKAYWPKLLTETISASSHWVPAIAPVQTQTALQALGIYAVTREGIWGNPEQADTEKGKVVIEATVQKAYEEINRLLELVHNLKKQDTP